MSGCTLNVKNLSKTFKNGNDVNEVLSNISLDVAPGEWVVLMGQSGSGKSTLLKCVSGLLEYDRGDVEVANLKLSRLTSAEKVALRKTKIGFVFQEYNLVEELNAEQNVSLPLVLNGEKKINDRSLAALENTGIAQLRHRDCIDLSGGEKQRVAIARALAQEPEILFADEPTGSLDSKTGSQVLKLFRKLATSGSSILMVTHDLFSACRADRVAILADGEIVKFIEKPTEKELFHELENV